MKTPATKIIWSVIAAHTVRSPYTESVIKIGGVSYRIVGVRAPIIDAKLPVVAMYKDGADSPRNAEVREKAEQEFVAAATKLILGNQPFCTTLCRGWAIPDLVWSRKPTA